MIVKITHPETHEELKFGPKGMKSDSQIDNNVVSSIKASIPPSAILPTYRPPLSGYVSLSGSCPMNFYSSMPAGSYSNISSTFHQPLKTKTGISNDSRPLTGQNKLGYRICYQAQSHAIDVCTEKKSEQIRASQKKRKRSNTCDYDQRTSKRANNFNFVRLSDYKRLENVSSYSLDVENKQLCYIMARQGVKYCKSATEDINDDEESLSSTEDQLKVVLEFLKAVPRSFNKDFWPKSFVFEDIAGFFTDLIKYLAKIVDSDGDTLLVQQKEMKMQIINIASNSLKL